MIIAGQPVLAAVCGVNSGIVPLQVIRGSLLTASRRADQTVGTFRKRIDAVKRHVHSVAAK